MKILSVNYPKNEDEEKKISYLASAYDERIKPLIAESSTKLTLPAPDLKKSLRGSASIPLQFRTLMFRNRCGFKRDPK